MFLSYSIFPYLKQLIYLLKSGTAVLKIQIPRRKKLNKLKFPWETVCKVGGVFTFRKLRYLMANYVDFYAGRFEKLYWPA